MSRVNWKRVQPASVRDALELCKEHARERHNLSVQRIADRLALPDHFTLYKWIQTGRMPTIVIPAYENACGINLVSRWVAASAGKLLIDLPTGRRATAEDVQQLQEVLLETTAALMAFYNGKQDADDTLAAIRNAMEALAWHRGNVTQHAQPQLELGD